MQHKLYRVLRTTYHTFHWSRHAVRNYGILRKHFGAEYAALCFRQDAAAYFKTADRERLTAEKNSRIKAMLTEELLPVLEQHRSSRCTNSTPAAERKIWVFWWSGFADAPAIVRAAVQSIRAETGVSPTLLDQHNYRQYVQLPEDICQKHDAGIIGHAHFSDILRLSLLAKHGGLWIDATVYFSRPISREILEREFFTCKMAVNDPLIPSHYLWAGWLLGGDRTFPLFSFAADALIHYWRNHDLVADYLLMDYIFDLAYEQIPDVRRGIDGLAPCCPDRHELMNRINAPYDPAFFDRDTWFYKLSYRYGAPKTVTADAKMTFYGFLTREDDDHEA